MAVGKGGHALALAVTGGKVALDYPSQSLTLVWSGRAWGIWIERQAEAAGQAHATMITPPVSTPVVDTGNCQLLPRVGAMPELGLRRGSLG